MRALGLDIGTKRLGVAISDPTGRVATPLCVLDTSRALAGGPELKRIIEDWEVEVLVCGLPTTLTGEMGPQAASIKAQAQQLARISGLELFFVDERMSSSQAKRILREQGFDERAMRGKVDKIAASLFLQCWLDARTRVDSICQD